MAKESLDPAIAESTIYRARCGNTSRDNGDIRFDDESKPAATNGLSVESKNSGVGPITLFVYVHRLLECRIYAKPISGRQIDNWAYQHNSARHHTTENELLKGLQLKIFEEGDRKDRQSKIAKCIDRCVHHVGVDKQFHFRASESDMLLPYSTVRILKAVETIDKAYVNSAKITKRVAKEKYQGDHDESIVPAGDAPHPNPNVQA
ncbi:MAG: hypothetical protein LQ350_007676 [Teloschistes chrysophthalmus]|nr:MAG: hypothetical protein LQ350_007676 [Niorma chrysophthalma]